MALLRDLKPGAQRPFGWPFCAAASPERKGRLVAVLRGSSPERKGRLVAVLRDLKKDDKLKAMPHTEPVRVTIFNQTYSLVASEEPGRIEHLAQRVDDLMSSIAVRAGNVDSTRAAVLACLHLADELDLLERRLATLKDRVDDQAKRFTILLDEVMEGEPAIPR